MKVMRGDEISVVCVWVREGESEREREKERMQVEDKLKGMRA